MIKGIIFDLGQTLIHATGDWPAIAATGAEAMAQWYIKKKHIKLDAEALAQTFLAERENSRQAADQTQQEVLAQHTLREALKKIAAPASTTATVEAAIKVFFEPEEAAWQPYPDAMATLQQLRSRNYRLGLYSNASDDLLIQRLVNRNGFRPYLSPTFSSAGCGWRKPRREGFGLIAQRWGLTPAEIVVVGDDPATDIAGAHNAGMASILLARPELTHPTNLQPTAIAHTLAELPALIASL